MIEASAPGKLMLAGEYVVADGHAPAVAAALDRRARVTLEADGAGWRVSAADLGLREAPLSEVPVLREVVDRFGDGVEGGHLRVVSELGAGPDKPGLGGSAAVAVAAAGAVARRAGRATPSVGELVAAHRAAQGGRGSGYDVALARAGGVGIYRPGSEGPTLEPAVWPAGLRAAVLFTGCGSPTPTLLARLSERRRERPEDVERSLARIGEAAHAVAGAWPTSPASGDAETSGSPVDLPRLLRALASAQEALDGMERELGIGIGAQGHRELLATIEESGAVARTSGAGGGDCAWALSDDPEVIAHVVSRTEAAGYPRLDVGFPGDGLRVAEGEGAP